jgi:2-deoxy-D-gluconate 3-dehydrogenase
MPDFAGKSVLVTGAGRGLGKATAIAFARSGARVGVVDVDEEAARSCVSEIQQLGGSAHFWLCDVGKTEEVESMVSQALQEFTAIDVLFNNAGINRRIPMAEWTETDWEEVIRVNFVGCFCVARAVGRSMVERRSGNIVNMAALGGPVIGLGRGTQIYTGTKGAVAAMSRDLAAEWAPYGIRVNCVAPGWIDTEINAPLLAQPDIVQRVIDRVPLGRWGNPEDVAGPVLFLASDAARYITGHLLPIDGGASAIIRLT